MRSIRYMMRSRRMEIRMRMRSMDDDEERRDNKGI
jgi:hypothetical protein